MKKKRNIKRNGKGEPPISSLNSEYRDLQNGNNR